MTDKRGSQAGASAASPTPDFGQESVIKPGLSPWMRKLVVRGTDPPPGASSPNRLSAPTPASAATAAAAVAAAVAAAAPLPAPSPPQPPPVLPTADAPDPLPLPASLAPETMFVPALPVALAAAHAPSTPPPPPPLTDPFAEPLTDGAPGATEPLLMALPPGLRRASPNATAQPVSTPPVRAPQGGALPQQHGAIDAAQVARALLAAGATVPGTEPAAAAGEDAADGPVTGGGPTAGYAASIVVMAAMDIEPTGGVSTPNGGTGDRNGGSDKAAPDGGGGGGGGQPKAAFADVRTQEEISREKKDKARVRTEQAQLEKRQEELDLENLDFCRRQFILGCFGLPLLHFITFVYFLPEICTAVGNYRIRKYVWLSLIVGIVESFVWTLWYVVFRLVSDGNGRFDSLKIPFDGLTKPGWFA